MPNAPRVCFDRILPRDLHRPAPPADTEAGRRMRAAIVIKKLWPNGSTLRSRFLGGTAAQHAEVKKFAEQWSQHANLKLTFDTVPDAEFRISFLDDGSWSYIGKDCLDIPRDAATMNFGWLDEGVVLHEFGHALGLIHEHQNPQGGIKWNKPNVYRDLGGSPNFWDKATVDHNMFKTYDSNQIRATNVDKHSVMLYTIPKSWTLDGFESRPNDVLSDLDRTFIGGAENYPFTQAAGPVELPVAEATATEAEIGKPGEEDLFTFKAAKAGRFTVETEGSTDVVMALYGPNGKTQRIAQDDDSGVDSNAKIVADLAPGTYYVQVRHYNSANGKGKYGVKVARS
ncbi:MAG: pre-peptidase C-terminal domain-containing protein [Gemmatimonadaceae bacterium]